PISWRTTEYAVVSVAATRVFTWYHGVSWCITPVAVAVAVQVQYSQEPAQSPTRRASRVPGLLVLSLSLDVLHRGCLPLACRPYPTPRRAIRGIRTARFCGHPKPLTTLLALLVPLCPPYN